VLAWTVDKAISLAGGRETVSSQAELGHLHLRSRDAGRGLPRGLPGLPISAQRRSSPRSVRTSPKARPERHLELSYAIALLIEGRSGGASTKHLYRSGTSSTGDHILWLSSGTTPNLRHQASGGGTVTITSSVAIVNDTTWSTIVGTWRPRRLELYVDGFSRASSTAAAAGTSALFGIYRWGWGFSTSQDFNGDIALVACFASSWTPAMVRRWHADPFGFLLPWGEVPALFGSAPPATPPRPAPAWSPS
jgi:Concanavalin A-like lectin/glucanases superfamily